MHNHASSSTWFQALHRSASCQHTASPLILPLSPHSPSAFLVCSPSHLYGPVDLQQHLIPGRPCNQVAALQFTGQCTVLYLLTQQQLCIQLITRVVPINLQQHSMAEQSAAGMSVHRHGIAWPLFSVCWRSSSSLAFLPLLGSFLSTCRSTPQHTTARALGGQDDELFCRSQSTRRVCSRTPTTPAVKPPSTNYILQSPVLPHLSFPPLPAQASSLPPCHP